MKTTATGLALCTAIAALALWLVHPAASSLTAGPVSDWSGSGTRPRATRRAASGLLRPVGKKALGGGHHIVGGGESLGFGSEGFYVTINRPLDNGSGWRVAWYADIDVARFYVQLFAICAKA